MSGALSRARSRICVIAAAIAVDGADAMVVMDDAAAHMAGDIFIRVLDEVAGRYGKVWA